MVVVVVVVVVVLDHLRDLFGKLDHVLGLGPVSPPPLVVATDCMESALLLNVIRLN